MALSGCWLGSERGPAGSEGALERPDRLAREAGGGENGYSRAEGAPSGGRYPPGGWNGLGGDVGEKGSRGYPVSAQGTASTSERIFSRRPARTWASARAIITVRASPTRAATRLRPRRKCRSNPKSLSRRL